jgi:hypothetical protein
VGPHVRAWVVARACLWGPPASGLCPTAAGRLGETPIVVGLAQEASGGSATVGLARTWVAMGKSCKGVDGGGYL